MYKFAEKMEDLKKKIISLMNTFIQKTLKIVLTNKNYFMNTNIKSF